MPGDSQPEHPASAAALHELLHGLSVALHGSAGPKLTHRDFFQWISRLLLSKFTQSQHLVPYGSQPQCNLVSVGLIAQRREIDGRN